MKAPTKSQVFSRLDTRIESQCSEQEGCCCATCLRLGQAVSAIDSEGSDTIEYIDSSVTKEAYLAAIVSRKTESLTKKQYDNLIMYKENKNALPIEVRRDLRQKASTFEYENDGTNLPWPKGKVLYKILYNNSKQHKRVGRKLWVPPDKINEVISFFHSKGANKHHGWNRTFKLVKELHKGVSELDVRNFCNICEVCTKFEYVKKKPRLKPILSAGVMQRLQIDLKEFEYYEEDNDGYKYLLTVVDHFSGFPWAFPLFNKTAEEVASHLIELFMVFGPPGFLHSDNGGEFVNGVMDELERIFSFKPAHGKAYNPREQGLVEKFNGTISNTLSKMIFERKSNRWIDFLSPALLAYRVTVGVTGKTPFEIFFVRQPNFIYLYPGTNITYEGCEEIHVGNEQEVLEIHDELMQAVREKREQNAIKMKARWDSINTQKVAVGDYILVNPRPIHKKNGEKTHRNALIFSSGRGD